MSTYGQFESKITHRESDHILNYAARKVWRIQPLIGVGLAEEIYYTLLKVAS